MKKCPFCAEDIQDEAVKCRYCGEFLKKDNPQKWYHKPLSLVVAFLCVGPLMLPLVWLNPTMNKTKKLIWSLAILLISAVFVIAFIHGLKMINNYYDQIFKYAN